MSNVHLQFWITQIPLQIQIHNVCTNTNQDWDVWCLSIKTCICFPHITVIIINSEIWWQWSNMMTMIKYGINNQLMMRVTKIWCPWWRYDDDNQNMMTLVKIWWQWSECDDNDQNVMTVVTIWLYSSQYDDNDQNMMTMVIIWWQWQKW